MPRLKAILFFIIIALATYVEVKAQGEEQVFQLSGLVVSGEESFGVPGVHIYIPKAGRGTTSNNLGYFSIPVLEGDSVIFSAINFKKQYYIVSRADNPLLSVIVKLENDTTVLPVVEIFPYPTEEVFKEAFVALRLPETDMDRMRKNYEKNLLQRIAFNEPMTAEMNYSWFMNQNITRIEQRNMAPTISLLNPFAWAQFIKSVKRGDLKRKEYRHEEKE